MNYIHKNLAFRRLKKNKYIWINIVGLSLGIAVFMTLFLFLQNENSYEKVHQNSDRIYRIEQNKKEGDVYRKTCGIPTPLSLVIDQDIPGIEASTRMIDQHSAVLQLEDGSQVRVEDIIFADKEFLEMFSYPVIHGAADGNLDQPHMAVITEKFSRQLFGIDNSVGRKIRYGSDPEIEIQSVVKQLSKNTHLNFSLLISFETDVSSDETGGWYDNWSHSYVLLDENNSADNINGQLAHYLKKYQGEESENILYLKPLGDIHSRSEVTDEYALVGSYQNNLIYVIIAILIILIACINYINLTVAHSAARIKEIGIRKVIGANRKQLIKQLLGESGISIIISTLLALILIELFLPIFNSLVNRNLGVDYLNNWSFFTVFISISLAIGLITGFIPAKTMSGFHPLSMASNSIKKGKKGLYFRYGLVLFQFFISISLIACTLLLFKQYNFLKNANLGYDKEHVLTIGLTNPDIQKFRQFKIESEKLPGIKRVDCSDYLPMSSSNYTGFKWAGAKDDESLKMNINYVGPEFTDVYDIKLVNGTGFRMEMSERDQIYVLLNEAAVKEIGWKDDPIGKELTWPVDYRGMDTKKGIVAGITENFHYLSKHQPINSLIMPLLHLDNAGWNLSIKLLPGNMKEQVASLEQVFKTAYPEELFNFQFADDIINDLYNSEQKMSSLVFSLTLIAIVIAIMGLIGLVSYTASEKTKEIGIRKVNGASTGSIVTLLSRDFAKLLFLGFVLSCPISWYIMEVWLQQFAYQTPISWWIFSLTLGGILLISFFSISFQTIKAALKNPVDALRYE
jgi:putative ABC transport system permease protein